MRLAIETSTSAIGLERLSVDVGEDGSIGFSRTVLKSLELSHLMARNSGPSLQRSVYSTAPIIHVWHARIPHSPSEFAILWNILAEDEKDRADRYHSSANWERYVFTRALLRVTLGRYLELPPGSIQLEYGRWGKPAISWPQPARQLRFNVSHCRDVAVLAFAMGHEVGVDLEPIHSEVAWEEVARTVLTQEEIMQLYELPAQLRQEGFVACWTRKEALLKAHGFGLRARLQSLEISAAPLQAASTVGIT